MWLRHLLHRSGCLPCGPRAWSRASPRPVGNGSLHRAGICYGPHTGRCPETRSRANLAQYEISTSPATVTSLKIIFLSHPAHSIFSPRGPVHSNFSGPRPFEIKTMLASSRKVISGLWTLTMVLNSVVAPQSLTNHVAASVLSGESDS